MFIVQKVNLATREESDIPVGMMDVYQEFNTLSEKFKIMKFKSKVSSNKPSFVLNLRYFCERKVSGIGVLFFTESGEELCL